MLLYLAICKSASLHALTLSLRLFWICGFYQLKSRYQQRYLFQKGNIGVLQEKHVLCLHHGLSECLFTKMN